MKFSYRSYLLCIAYFVTAACFWVLFRFVGLSSVAAFDSLDHDSLNHVALFAKAIVIGCGIGTIFFFVSRGLDTPAIRRRPYGMLIALYALSNVICVTLALMALSLMNIVIEHKEFTVAAFTSRLLSINFLVILIYYSLVSFAFVILKEIDRKFGPGNLRELVMGTFYHPREVELIVMFLDLKDSTSHAERLGHLEFGRLIQDCFIDMSVVTDFKAQFYQYVGDESILLWDVTEGIEEANCLRAYFAFSRRLEQRRDYYMSRYGTMPSFKAGVNIGTAIVLEVGEIKREISYLGDVLNTAARIQGLCNTHRENLLISANLQARLATAPGNLAIDAIGSTELRGRAEAVNLFRVRQQVDNPLIEP